MKSNLRNEIKAYIVRSGCTMQEVVDLLSDEHGWSDSVSNLSNKLQRESLRYTEAVQLADALGGEAGEQGAAQFVAAELFCLQEQPGRRVGMQDARPGCDHCVVDLGEIVEAAVGHVPIFHAGRGGDRRGAFRRGVAEAAVR